jgi:hypothetical protein
LYSLVFFFLAIVPACDPLKLSNVIIGVRLYVARRKVQVIERCRRDVDYGPENGLKVALQLIEEWRRIS